MNLLAPVSTIMTKDLITVGENDPLKKIGEIFSANRIHHIPVVDNGKLLGLVSKSDYLFFKRGFNGGIIEKDIDAFRLKTHTAGEIMTKGIATLEADERINVALEVFKENLFHAIPILENGKIAGIVTSLDVIKNLAEDRGAENTYNIK